MTPVDPATVVTATGSCPQTHGGVPIGAPEGGGGSIYYPTDQESLADGGGTTLRRGLTDLVGGLTRPLWASGELCTWEGGGPTGGPGVDLRVGGPRPVPPAAEGTELATYPPRRTYLDHSWPAYQTPLPSFTDEEVVVGSKP